MRTPQQQETTLNNTRREEEELQHEARLQLDMPGTLACCGFDGDLFWTDPATGEVRARAVL